MTTRIARCTCGQLTAKTSTEPIRVSVCHCLSCQRRSGSAFAAQARFSASTVALTGESNCFDRIGDEGSRATFHFCPTCADTVYYVSDARPDDVIIPIGAFADPNFPAPTFSVYEDRMHAWVTMPVDMDHMR